MSTEFGVESWRNIESHIRERDVEGLSEYLDTLTPADVARAISRLR